MLGGDRALALADQPVALVAPCEHALRAALGDLTHLAPSREQHPPRARRRDALEALSEIVEAVEHPRVREQPARQIEHGSRSAKQVEQPLRPWRGRVAGRATGSLARSRSDGVRVLARGIPGEQRRAPVLADTVKQRASALHVAHERRVEPSAERRRER